MNQHLRILTTNKLITVCGYPLDSEDTTDDNKPHTLNAEFHSLNENESDSASIPAVVEVNQDKENSSDHPSQSQTSKHSSSSGTLISIELTLMEYYAPYGMLKEKRKYIWSNLQNVLHLIKNKKCKVFGL